MAKDDLLPKKKATSSAGSSRASAGASASMLRLMRITRGVGVVAGGLVTLVGVMALVGLVTDSFWARLIVAAVVVLGLPAFVAKRVLSRTNLGGGPAMVVDLFAIVLLGIALVLALADFATRPLLVREGDRYARSGSRAAARVVYFLAGVSPVFPDEKAAGAPAAGSASGSASASSSAAAQPTNDASM